MVYKEALKKGIMILEANDVADANLDAWYLLSYVTGMSKSRYILDQNQQMDDNELYRYQDVLFERAKHVPLQHITGEQDFMGLTFWVNENVLVPRQDTETLVEEVLKDIPSGSHILDMCTGSGCILISLIAHGQGLSGIGIDYSEDVLVVAKENSARLVNNKAVFLHSNLFEKVTGKFNVIVSNPPYIRTADVEELSTEVKDHEPRMALDGTEDGLFFYREITAQAVRYLNDGGYLFYEIGYDQGDDVSGLMKEAGFLDVQVIKDLAGHDRVVKGHL